MFLLYSSCGWDIGYCFAVWFRLKENQAHTSIIAWLLVLVFAFSSLLPHAALSSESESYLPHQDLTWRFLCGSKWRTRLDRCPTSLLHPSFRMSKVWSFPWRIFDGKAHSLLGHVKRIRSSGSKAFRALEIPHIPKP